MKSHGHIKITLITLLVVAFGWGSTYLVMKGLELARPSTIAVETIPQKALILEANVVNPDVPAIPQTKSSKKLTIMISGDVMFDRSIRAYGERNGYDSLFDDSIVSLFKKADIVVANLEGPITSYPSKTLVNGKTTEELTFTFPAKSRQALTHAGITMVSLANNHTDNFGFLGFMETQDWLQDAGISWFGNPWNSTSTKMSREKTSATKSPIATVITKSGITVAFVGYHSFQLGIDNVIAEIKRVSGPDVFTIVMPHWGEEYVAKPSERLKSQARAFIAAGADAIIGAHPHIVMDNEWVSAVPVYYSIGNLLFDQYFSPEVMRGNVIELNLKQDNSGPYLDHIEVHDVHLKIGKGVVLNE